MLSLVRTESCVCWGVTPQEWPDPAAGHRPGVGLNTDHEDFSSRDLWQALVLQAIVLPTVCF